MKTAVRPRRTEAWAPPGAIMPFAIDPSSVKIDEYKNQMRD